MLQTHVVFPATALSVRSTLAQILGTPAFSGYSCGLRDAAQIVLAEALNNIVEHSYAAQEGEIELTLTFEAAGLRCQIRDRGTPIRQGQLPAGRNPMSDDPEELPEGGFGWFLIRSLAQEIDYSCDSTENCLRFYLPTEKIRD